MGFWGEKGGIGLDHDPVVRDQVARPGDFRGVREGDDAGERDPPPEVEHRPGVGFVAREAVEDEPVVREAGGIEDRDEFFEGLPAVDDDRLGKTFGGPRLDSGELFLQHGALEIASRFRIVVIEPEVALLLRHRALLFLVVGALLLIAAARPALRTLAGAAGLFSMMSFVLLAWLSQTDNVALERIVRVDLGVSVVLGAALFAHLARSRLTRD